MKQTLIENILSGEYKINFISKEDFEKGIIDCYNEEKNFYLLNVELLSSFSSKNLIKAESLLTHELNDVFGEDIKIYKSFQNRYKFILRDEQAKNIKKDLSRVINFFKVPVKTKDGYIYINLKVGLVFSGTDESIEKLVLRSRLALMYAEENHFSVYTQNMYKRYYIDLKLEELLYEAFVKDEFHPFFQAYVDSETKEFIGAEVLMRWIKSDEKVIPPNLFIPVLERNRFIIEVELKFIKKIFSLFKFWQDEYNKTIKLSINVSAVQLSNPRFLEEMEKIANDFKIEKNIITFEITESYVIENVEAAAETMTKLKKLGFNISLDDFGTGYATLTHLKSLPIDVVKIDMAFIKNILVDDKSEIIVQHIINMSKKMNLKTICEGAETEEQYLKLKELGADIIQGFYFAKPIPLGEFEEDYII